MFLFSVDSRKIEALKQKKAIDKIANILLKHRSDDIKIEAINALSALQDSVAIEPLIQILNNGHSNVKIAAVNALKQMNDERAVAPLTSLLYNKNLINEIQSAVVDALKELDPEVLFQVCKVNNPVARTMTIEALKSLEEDRIWELSTKALKSDDSRIRRLSIELIEELHDARALELLNQALTDEDRHVRMKSIEVLNSLRDIRAASSIIQAIKNNKSDSQFIEIAIDTLKEFGTESLAQALEDKDSQIRLISIEALKELGSEHAVELIIPVLNDTDHLVLMKSIDALGQLGDNRAVGPLIQVLSDTDPGVRTSAAHALGKLAGEQAVEPLARTAFEDTESSIREEATLALGKIGCIQAVKSLIQIRVSGNTDLISKTTSALKEQDKDRVLEASIQVLEAKDTDPKVRRVVVDVLGITKNNRAVGPLVQALEDNDPSVRKAATESLGRIDDGQIVGPLVQALEDIDSYVRCEASKSLERMEEGANSEFVRFMQENEHGRELVTHALQDTASTVRQRIANVLGRTGVRSVKPLIQALGDENSLVQNTARGALRQIFVNSPMSEFVQELGGVDPEIRHNAVDVLEKYVSDLRTSRMANDAVLSLKAEADEEAVLRKHGLNSRTSRVATLSFKIEVASVRGFYEVAMGPTHEETSLDELIRAIEHADSIPVKESISPIRHKWSSPAIGDLFTEFGENLPEDRQIDENLRSGISLAQSHNWDRAVEIFNSAIETSSDYDVPYLWLGDFEKTKKGAAHTVGVLRDAAKKCRRKNELLKEAAEISLMECGNVREAIHLFAQSIAALKEKPRRADEITSHRACLFMKEVFIAFKDPVGKKWAEDMQDISSLDHSLVIRIHQAINKVSLAEREVISRELPEIRDHLRKRFPN